MHKKTYLHISHQIFEATCRSTNTNRIYHSLAQLEPNTTFFTIPGHKERAYTPTLPNKPIQTCSACVCQKNLKKIQLTCAHRENSAKKITDTKKVYRKLQYELLYPHKDIPAHLVTSQGSSLCVSECIASLCELNLAFACTVLTVARVQNFRRTRQHRTCMFTFNQN